MKEFIFRIDENTSDYEEIFVGWIMRHCKELIRCDDCKHQIKHFHTDRRVKDGGYWIYSCELNDDPFVAHVVNGEPHSYCDRSERKEE